MKQLQKVRNQFLYESRKHNHDVLLANWETSSSRNLAFSKVANKITNHNNGAYDKIPKLTLRDMRMRHSPRKN